MQFFKYLPAFFFFLTCSIASAQNSWTIKADFPGTLRFGAVGFTIGFIFAMNTKSTSLFKTMLFCIYEEEASY